MTRHSKDETHRTKFIERALQGGTITLEIVKEVADLAQVPYLSKVAGLVLKIFATVEAVKDNKTGFQELAQEATKIFVTLMLSYEHSAEGSWPPNNLTQVVKELIHTLTETIELANTNKVRHILLRVLSSKTDPGEIERLRRRMQSSLEIFKFQSHITTNQTLLSLTSMVQMQMNFEAEIRRATTHTRRTQVMKELRERSHPGAGFDAAARCDVPKCSPDTRQAIISYVGSWLEDADELDRILWIHGPAGCGKTALAQTIAFLYQQSGHLLGSFFFSRSGGSRPKTKSEFVVTIAFQICIAIPAMAEYVATALDDDPGIFDRDLVIQMKTLITGPFNKLLEDYTADVSNLEGKHWWLILVDGLDECEGADAQQEVLQLISQITSGTYRFPLRVIIASRPEYAIKKLVISGTLGLSSIHKIALAVDYQANEDIKIFILSRFAQIKQFHPSAIDLPDNWPRDEVVKTLVRRSQGLFIYASLVMKYIESAEDHPQERLEEIVALMSLNRGGSIADTPFTQLDAMYSHILSRILPRNQQRVKDILCIVIYERPRYYFDLDEGFHSQSLSACDALMDSKLGGARTLLKDLASVLKIPDASNQAGLELFHASFADFLQDNFRAGLTVPVFLCLPNDAHARLAKLYFQFYYRVTSWNSNPEHQDLKTSIILSRILYHCENTDHSVLQDGVVHNFDLRPSLRRNPDNKPKWWERLRTCIHILCWLRKQKCDDDVKEGLYSRNRSYVQFAMRTYWSQFSPEVCSHISFLLTLRFRPHFINADFDLYPDRIPFAWYNPDHHRMHAEILVDLVSETSELYFEGKNKALHVASWLVHLLQLDPEDNTHTYSKFIAPKWIPDLLVVVLEQAPVDKELDELLRRQNFPEWLTLLFKSTLTNAFEAYIQKCR